MAGLLAVLVAAISVLCAQAAGTIAPPRGRRQQHHVVDTIDGTPHPSTVNCTWHYIEQRLDHFSPGASGAGNATYRQRYCVYDGWWKPAAAGVILFYTGNESPVEEYVNNTGLMWDLAPKLGALLVFAEHRYFGESIPTLAGQANCLAFATSAQALAD